jgi:hypothetical protein
VEDDSRDGQAEAIEPRIKPICGVGRIDGSGSTPWLPSDRRSGGPANEAG